jgi:hypothetical protein
MKSIKEAKTIPGEKKIIEQDIKRPIPSNKSTILFPLSFLAIL